jgi:ADP-heptose:LPS heptosyltransferase
MFCVFMYFCYKFYRMKKILIIRFSSIGDIVLTTPVIRCLKKQLNAEVHYLTKSSFKGMLNNNPYVDKVHTIDKEISKELIAELKAENFDFVADLHHNLRTLRLKNALNTPSKSFPKYNIQKWLLVNLKIDRMPKIHIVDRYMETVSTLGVVNDNEGLDYFIPENSRVNLSRLPEGQAKGYVGLVIGGQHATKMMPQTKLIEVCRNLSEPIVLLGGPEDSDRAEEIVQSVGTKVFNACGKFKLDESASLVQQANWIITHDTGLMHIAAAFKKRIVSVWGNTVPELGMYPYLADPKSKIVEIKGLSCRPCSKIGYSKCPKGHFKCMEHEVSDLMI